jgi:hypothetical protein
MRIETGATGAVVTGGTVVAALWSAPAVCRRHVDLQRVCSALCCHTS